MTEKESLNLEELLQVLDEELIQVNDDVDDKPLSKKTRIEAALTRYTADLKELQRYVFFDPLKNYTRNLIATDHENFSVMLLCWNKKKIQSHS